MVKIEFFPETATFSFKPQKSHAYIEDPLLVERINNNFLCLLFYRRLCY